ncbi:MAG: methionyl-tRNA formyltransferase [Planctomycetes bacterium]|nr:methionyl-tRNA formyltransferase [Planctomycetota bacterium]
MKIIFIGSSAFGVPTLRMLAKQPKHQLMGVITQPDGRKGRGLKEAAISPVKEETLKHRIEIWQPESINEPVFIGQLKNKNPDLIIVAAYGQKLGREILNLPPYGCINIHPSLLPKYRGSAPVNYAILNGDGQTGISIIRMVEKMDAGPVLKQAVVAIKDDETAAELEDRLAIESAGIIQGLLADVENKNAGHTAQDEAKVTFAPKLKKSDGELDWSGPARKILNRIRAMQPWPGAYTYLNQKGKPPLKIDILEAKIYALSHDVLPVGAIAETNAEGIGIVCAGTELIAITRLKPAGGRALTVREFINGYRLKIGDRFGKETE